MAMGVMMSTNAKRVLIEDNWIVLGSQSVACPCKSNINDYFQLRKFEKN